MGIGRLAIWMLISPVECIVYLVQNWSERLPNDVTDCTPNTYCFSGNTLFSMTAEYADFFGR
jgi:hypothetical protein